MGNSLKIETFPNPSDEKFSIIIEANQESIANLQIINIFGEVKVKKQVVIKTGLTHLEIDASLESGVYFISIRNGNNSESTKQIIINK